LRSIVDSVAAPDWLATNIQPDWFDRYGHRVENYRLPKLDSEREALGSTIGADGLALLDAIYDPTAPQWLRQIPGVETLRQIWVQQFYAPEPGQTHLISRNIILQGFNSGLSYIFR
jgi:transposase